MSDWCLRSHHSPDDRRSLHCSGSGSLLRSKAVCLEIAPGTPTGSHFDRRHRRAPGHSTGHPGAFGPSSSLPEAPYLLSVKSLKAVSAAIFMAEVGDPKRYQAAAQWVKLAGIQPAPNTSGKKQRSRTPRSHQGRTRLRTMLYFTCLRMLQQDNHFAQINSHLQRRQNNPLTKMQALGVLMNKLLHILWALIHNQTFYNPSFGQSI